MWCGEYFLSNIYQKASCTLCLSGTYQSATSHNNTVCIDIRTCSATKIPLEDETRKSDATCVCQCHNGNLDPLNPKTDDCETSAGCVNCNKGYSLNQASQLCQKCSAGMYQPNQGSTDQCIESKCDAGEYYLGDNINDKYPCSPCNYGTYRNETSHNFDTCVPHITEESCKVLKMIRRRLSSVESTDLTQDLYYCGSCAYGTYFDTTTQQCELKICPPGREQSRRYPNRCASCPAGKFKNGAGTLTCEACPAGKSTNNLLGQTSCNYCVPGYGYNATLDDCELCNASFKKYNNITSSMMDQGGICSPVACPLGQGYSLKTEQSVVNNTDASYHCAPCGDGTFSDNADDGECKSAEHYTCHAGEYIEYDPTKEPACKPCPSDTYQDSNNHKSASCKNRLNTCPAGKYVNYLSDLTKDNDCVSCQVGKYQDVDHWRFFEHLNTSCKVCVKGQYQNQIGQTQCNTCESGKYQDLTGQSLCKEKRTTCDIGQGLVSRDVTQDDDCQDCAGTEFTDQTSYTCQPRRTTCPDGQFLTIERPGYDNTCGDKTEYCNAGYYLFLNSDDDANNLCLECNPGFYQDTWHSMKHCKPKTKTCGAGKRFNEVPGLKANNQCYGCSAGKYQDETNHNSTTCKDCSAGEYQNQNGQSSCKECIRGYYMSEKGAGNCVACAPGKFSGDGASECQLKSTCGAGKYVDVSNTVAADSCETCPDGTYQDELDHSSSECKSPKTQCGPGQYNEVSELTLKQNSCIQCPTGYYKSIVGTLRTECNSKEFSSTTMVYTFMCPAKYKMLYKDDPTRNMDCEQCPSGQMTTNDKATECTDITTECPPGEYLISSGGQAFEDNTCRECISGKYKVGTTTDRLCHDKTTSCGPGRYFNESSDARSDNQCIECPDGKYQDQNIHTEDQCKTKLTSCDTGKHLVVNPGKNNNNECLDSITKCGPGKYLQLGATVDDNQCIDCDAGKYKVGSNANTSCLEKNSLWSWKSICCLFRDR